MHSCVRGDGDRRRSAAWIQRGRRFFLKWPYAMRCVLVIVASDDNSLDREQVGMRAVGNCRVVTLPESENLVW